MNDSKSVAPDNQTVAGVIGVLASNNNRLVNIKENLYYIIALLKNNGSAEDPDKSETGKDIKGLPKESVGLIDEIHGLAGSNRYNIEDLEGLINEIKYKLK